MDKQMMIEEAKKARENSYSPYSHFKVGAALLTRDGKVFHGTNIENSSYPLCMCAERNAIYNAMNHGYKKDDFLCLSLIADTEGPVTPCGACRQVISELLPKGTPILMASLRGDLQETTPEELLPFAFDESALKNI